jgi:hypothetical protein
MPKEQAANQFVSACWYSAELAVEFEAAIKALAPIARKRRRRVKS